MRLDGRVAIVAGAGSGIGAAIAQRLAAAGAQVIAADIDRKAVEALAAKVAGVTAQTCDVTESAAVEALVNGAVQRFGRLDVMVNNVGSADAGWLKDATDESYQRVLALTLSAASSTFLRERALAEHRGWPLMERRRRASTI